MPVVLCFGDSNTHGTCAMGFPGDRRRLPREQRWPEVMAARLGEGWEVIAEGHPGRTSVFADPIEGPHKNGQLALPALLESHRPLDLVVVMLGTNDCKARFGAQATDIALGIGRLAREILSSDAGPAGTAPRLLIAAPVPILETGIFSDIFSGGAGKSRALPAALARVASEVGAGFWDAGMVAQVDPVDGIHLDVTAHAAIGEGLASAIVARIDP